MSNHKNPALARQQQIRQEDKQRQQQLNRLLQEAEPQFVRLLQSWLEQGAPKESGTGGGSGTKR